MAQRSFAPRWHRTYTIPVSVGSGTDIGFITDSGFAVADNVASATLDVETDSGFGAVNSDAQTGVSVVWYGTYTSLET